MTAPYASLDYCKSIMGAVQQTSGGTSINDAKLMSNLHAVSQRVDYLFAARRPLFLPWRETRRPLISASLVNSWAGTFSLPGYLLAQEGNATVNGTTIAAEGYPDADLPPFSSLRLTDCCTSWYGVGCTDCSSGPNRLTITGVWGYHADYANAWLDVDALAADITTTTATTFTVASAAGDDAYGQPHRISPGHLLQIDSEWVEVVDVNTNTVTVRRGVNGSTAATHLVSTTVSRWEVDEALKRAVARQAGLLYARFGAYTTTEIQAMGGEVRYPSDWLSEVMGALQAFADGV